MLSNLFSSHSSHSSLQTDGLSSAEDRKLSPKLTLLEGELISEVVLSDFVWSKVSTVTDPLLFLGPQLCLVPCSCHSSTWAYAEDILSSLLAFFFFVANEGYIVLGPESMKKP